MWLNDIDIFWNNYALTEKEKNSAKGFITDNWLLMKLHFNEPLEKNKKIIDMEDEIEEEDFFWTDYLLAKKSIVIMKESWATSIDDFDKIFWSVEVNGCDVNIEKQNTKINELQEESDKEQEKDFDSAQELSEQIKNWNID